MVHLGERVWCLADVEVSSAKTEVCDCKKKLVSINQLYLQQNEVISINQLNYKVLEKSHATEELVGYTNIQKEN